jgi:hypothetical protein
VIVKGFKRYLAKNNTIKNQILPINDDDSTDHRTDNPLYQLETDLRNRILLQPIRVPDHAWEQSLAFCSN